MSYAFVTSSAVARPHQLRYKRRVLSIP